MFRHARRSALLGAPLLVLSLAACSQTADYSTHPRPSLFGARSEPRAAPTGMEGNWASTDGVFIATFDNGTFTSRFTATNEILAKGTYQVNGGTMSLEWLSVATQQHRSAICAITSPRSVSCNQSGGGSFGLTRSA